MMSQPMLNRWVTAAAAASMRHHSSFAAAEGMYQPFLVDWMKVFPRDQVYVTRFEDYKNNELGVLQGIAEFLDIGGEH
jgi:hypothetical protein